MTTFSDPADDAHKALFPHPPDLFLEADPLKVLIKLLQSAHTERAPLFPLPEVPPPPRPDSKAGRPRQRYRLSLEISRIADRLIRVLNSCAGSQSVSSVDLSQVPATCEPTRVYAAEQSAEVRECWTCILARAKRIRSGRRCSLAERKAAR